MRQNTIARLASLMTVQLLFVGCTKNDDPQLADCPRGHTVKDGVCLPLCYGDLDCEAPAVCVENLCQTFPCKPGSDDCKAPLRCAVGGFCSRMTSTGHPCKESSECESNACECFDKECTIRKCRSAFCGRCQYATDSGNCIDGLGGQRGAEDPNPADNCGGVDTLCIEGTCKQTLHAACTDNDDCGSVCIGRQCAERAGVTEVCDTNDDADCRDDLVCKKGLCLRPQSSPCKQNAECVHGACECADANCTNRTCRKTFCGVCEYANDSNTCQAGLGKDAPVEDPNEADCSQDLACFAGQCRKQDGEKCDKNAECGHVCIGKVCKPLAGLGQTCDNDNDGRDCVTGMTCQAGMCRMENAQPCKHNEECANGTTCIIGTCAPKSQVLQLCDFSQDFKDNDDCAAGLECTGSNGRGTCKGSQGTSCTANEQCVHAACECLDEQCSSQACRPTLCSEACHYFDEQKKSCVPGLGTSTPIQDATGCAQEGFACYSTGCKKTEGQTCANNDECGQVCINSQCAPLSRLGEACDESDQAGDCNKLLACHAGTCLFPQGSGCKEAVACTTGHCVKETEENWGVCCDKACGGNCDSCQTAGRVGECLLVEAACQGTCDTCNPSDGNCVAVPEKCSGDCVECVESNNFFDCVAQEDRCGAGCGSCKGSGTSFSCVPDNSKCNECDLSMCDPRSDPQNGSVTYSCMDLFCAPPCDTATAPIFGYRCSPAVKVQPVAQEALNSTRLSRTRYVRAGAGQVKPKSVSVVCHEGTWGEVPGEVEGEPIDCPEPCQKLKTIEWKAKTAESFETQSRLCP